MIAIATQAHVVLNARFSGLIVCLGRKSKDTFPGSYLVVWRFDFGVLVYRNRSGDSLRQKLFEYFWGARTSYARKQLPNFQQVLQTLVFVKENSR